MNIENLLKGLNEAAIKIHNGNVDRGFWDKPLPLASLLMLCVTELAEAVEAERNEINSNLNEFEKQMDGYGVDDSPLSFKHEFEKHVKNSVEDEIADTFIRLLDVCAHYQIDIEKHIDLKVKYNNTRPRLHGKKY